MGKSTLLAALRHRCHRVVDTDDAPLAVLPQRVQQRTDNP
jgi:hypothetical protein